MQRKYLYLLILFLFVVIGIIHGVITISLNLFFSWFLIGLWICYTLHFLHKMNQYRQFNSPHNTSFFILGTMIMGILYSLWGYFTGLLGWNIFREAPIYLSFWTLLFAFPYLFYGIFSLYSCFMRYDLVYLGQKAVNARIFGYFVTSLMTVLGLCSLLFFLIVQPLGSFPFAFIHITPDILLLITSLLSIFVLLRYGIFGRRPSISEISASTRIRRDQPYRPTSRPTTPSRTMSRSTAPSAFSQPRTSINTISPSTTQRSRITQAPQTSSTQRIPEKEKERKQKLKKLLKYLKPKAGTLTLEDFKCIFCFSLPSYPEDQGRGIVVCPKCKHPAHADEFKDWMRNSNLCSRCDAVLPAQFRQNLQIIPVKTYAKVIRILMKKGT